MVKPQIIIEKKDDLKKPENVLVKVVTVGEEPAPLNLEPTYGPVVTRQQKGWRRCLCLSLLLTMFMLLSGLGMMFFRTYHMGSYGYGWCGTSYMDGWEDSDYFSDDYYFDYQGSDSIYEGRPYGNDALFAPRPTGPPMERFIQEGLQIQVDLNLVRINHIGDEFSQSITVLHDFDTSMSAYLMESSEVCYIQPLNTETSLTPEDFQSLIEDGEYQRQQFPMLSEIYAVVPDQIVDLGTVSEHVQTLCEGYSTYYIQNIPIDQARNFFRTVKSVIRQHRRDGTDSDGDIEELDGGALDHDTTDDDDEHRRLGGRRHGDGSRGRHGSSGSDDTDGSRQRRGILRLREFMVSLRFFNGQQVEDKHILRTDQLNLSAEGVERLQAYLKPSET